MAGGSFGQRLAELETGGRRGPWDWFVVSHHHADRGWSPHNRSRVDQAFGKLGWQDDVTDIDATLSAADTHLEGVQTLPLSFGGLREPYTYPDSNRNRAAVGIAQRQPCAVEDAADQRDGLRARLSRPQLQQQRERCRRRRQPGRQRRVDDRAAEPASKTIRFFARIDNVLDRRYASFGILGTNVFTGPGRSFDPDNPRHEQFRGYGAPRSMSVGMQIAFGGA